MGKVFLIDVAKCSGCYNCQFACKDEHCDNEWLPYAKKQPLTGQFWTKITEHVEGSIPKVKIHYIPEMCAHCDNPACLNACAFDAIYKREDGLVIIDPLKCNGCKACIKACPYDSIYFNDELNIAQKCTGCAHLIDAGKTPRCVDVCPTEALLYEDKEKITDKLDGAVCMKEESGCAPRLYYKNIPGKFIAGLIYDEAEEEVIIGAKCILVNKEDSSTFETETDDFGDFWFKDLSVGKYSLTIKAEGFEDKTFDNLDTTNSINIGDIPFKKN